MEVGKFVNMTIVYQLVYPYFHKTCFIRFNSAICRLLILSTRENLLLIKDGNGLSPLDHANKGTLHVLVNMYMCSGLFIPLIIMWHACM